MPKQTWEFCELISNRKTEIVVLRYYNGDRQIWLGTVNNPYFKDTQTISSCFEAVACWLGQSGWQIVSASHNEDIDVAKHYVFQRPTD